MAHHYPASLDRVRAEPPMLDADMTPADLAAVLRDLKFLRGHPETIRLDRDARDYLLDAVTARQGERSR